MLDAALGYASRGWRIHPLREKRPYLRDWPNKATDDTEVISKWWTRWPSANVGVLTGDYSILVIDSDRKAGRDGEVSLKALEFDLGPLPDTFEVTTPNGCHRYFAHPGTSISNSAGQLGDGVDVRSNNGYVVAAPSIVDGRQYEITAHRPLADLPESWVAHFASEKISQSINIDEGTRDDALFREAGKLRGKNFPVDQALERLLEINAAHCNPPLSREQVMKCLRSAYRYRPGYEPNDLGNAQRLLDAAEGRIIYVAETSTFCLYDDCQWISDPHTLITTGLLKQSNRRITYEASQIEDEKTRKHFERFAVTSQNTARLRSTIDNVQSEPDVAVPLSELDSDPFLLGVQNGVIDLRKGRFRKSKKGDLITKSAGCEYDKSARCPRWLKFLSQTFDDDDSLAEYVQSVIGYCMTGYTNEQILFALLGPGASGKSTFIETVAEMLGDYSANIRTESLMSNMRSGGGPSEDIARLVGVRFLTTTETSEGSRFNQAMIKDYTGGDRVTARFLYQGSFEFIPQFKLLIRGNHRPRFDGEDSGMARRIRLIPFAFPIEPGRRDPQLMARLRTELPGILNWAIEGCLNWQKVGFSEPKTVIEATRDYVAEMDVFGAYLTERCQSGKGYSVPFSRIYSTYQSWCKTNGHVPKSKSAIADSLTARAYFDKRMRVDGKPAHVRLGLRIRPRRTT